MVEVGSKAGSRLEGARTGAEDWLATREFSWCCRRERTTWSVESCGAGSRGEGKGAGGGGAEAGNGAIDATDGDGEREDAKGGVMPGGKGELTDGKAGSKPEWEGSEEAEDEAVAMEDADREGAVEDVEEDGAEADDDEAESKDAHMLGDRWCWDF